LVRNKDVEDAIKWVFAWIERICLPGYLVGSTADVFWGYAASAGMVGVCMCERLRKAITKRCEAAMRGAEWETCPDWRENGGFPRNEIRMKCYTLACYGGIDKRAIVQ
jgi:hypothetical protein